MPESPIIRRNERHGHRVDQRHQVGGRPSLRTILSMRPQDRDGSVGEAKRPSRHGPTPLVSSVANNSATEAVPQRRSVLTLNDRATSSRRRSIEDDIKLWSFSRRKNGRANSSRTLLFRVGSNCLRIVVGKLSRHVELAGLEVISTVPAAKRPKLTMMTVGRYLTRQGDDQITGYRATSQPIQR